MLNEGYPLAGIADNSPILIDQILGVCAEPSNARSVRVKPLLTKGNRVAQGLPTGF
jgi:hypothetical protein